MVLNLLYRKFIFMYIVDFIFNKFYNGIVD